MSEQQTEDQKKNEKKGGAAPWMQGSANVGSGSLGGAASQAASGGMLATIKAAIGPKMILTALIGTGASIGGMVGLQDFSVPRDPGESVFMEREGSASTAKPVVQEADDGTYNALELARQANTGKYGDVKGDAGAAGGEGAEGGEGAASAEGVETAEDAADAPGGIPGMDPNMMAQMAEGMSGEEESKAKKGLGSKFGKLSSSLGGRGGGPKLAGGSGLSGGIGGSFSKKSFSTPQGRLSSAGKGSRKVSRSKTAARGQKGSTRKGAFNRLNSMSKAMGNAKTGSAATTAATHSQQWDSAKDTGEGITGAGASGIGAGGESDFSDDEGDGGGNPLPGTNSSSPNSDGPDVDGVGGGKNVTPYQGTMDMMIAAMALVNILLIIMGILALLSKAGITQAYTKSLQTMVYGIIALLSAAVLVGALMIGKEHGQAGQGDLLAATASITLVAAVIGFVNPAWGYGLGTVMIIAGIAGLTMSLKGMSKADKVKEDQVKNEQAQADQAAAHNPYAGQ